MSPFFWNSFWQTSIPRSEACNQATPLYWPMWGWRYNIAKLYLPPSQVSQQVKSTLPPQDSTSLHCFQPGDGIVTKDLGRKHWHSKRWRGPLQVLQGMSLWGSPRELHELVPTIAERSLGQGRNSAVNARTDNARTDGRKRGRRKEQLSEFNKTPTRCTGLAIQTCQDSHSDRRTKCNI